MVIRSKNNFFIVVLLYYFLFSDILVALDPIELNNSILIGIIKKLDGIVVTSDDIAQMMLVRKGTIEILLGYYSKQNKSRIGRYEIDGKNFTLVDLVRLEMRIQELLNDASLTQQQKKKLYQKREKVQKCHSQAKLEFTKTTEPFIEQANHFKSLIVPLIGEWAQKRERPESILLKWSVTHENVLEEFYRIVGSCESLAQFCRDLDDFLATFVHNCPKAYTKFKEKYVESDAQSL